ncbi:MAG: TerB family tellurite resistance protein [Rhizobiales bacterium]|nr:TerB family tellurite resistance protein [Hyphomicrobiales bacterium]
MSIWGKIGGAAAGLTFGGPLGALLGAVAGHYFFDKDGSSIEQQQNQNGDTKNWANSNTNNWSRAQPEDSVIFTMGIIALGAKMAKADGVVTSDEVAAFKQVFKVPEHEAKNVAKLYNIAKKDIAGYQAYAKQLADLFKHKRATLEDVIDGLFHIAKADGVIHPKEVEFLTNVAEIFGFSQDEFDRIVARHGSRSDSGGVSGEGDPYKILGVKRGDDSKDIKTAYRKLVTENHPDKLIARGVPKEFIEIANEKLARINAAYDQITK